MAGMGKRFSDEGYNRPKPLISVSGTPMVLQALHDFQTAAEYRFVIRNDMDGSDEIKECIKQSFPESKFVEVGKVTNGQAVSAQLGVADLQDDEAWVTIAPCDSMAIYSHENLCIVMECADVIVWEQEVILRQSNNQKCMAGSKRKTV